MLSVRWRKVLRDVWGNKSRTSLVVLSMAVGVFGVGMIASARVTLSRELNDAYVAIQPAHAELTIEPFEEDLVEAVRHTPGVSDAEGRAALAVRVLSADKERILQLNVMPDYTDIRVGQVYPVSGDWPPPSRELLLERRSLDYIGAKVGDTLVIDARDGRRRPMRVAGVAYDLNAPPPALTGLSSGYITLDTLEWLGGERSFNQLHVRVNEDPGDKQTIQRVAERVAAKVERSERRVYYTFVREPGTHPFDGLLNNVLLLLGGIALVALVLSGFLVINTISAVLTQQVRQIGVMKAIGARTHQVLGMYMGMVLIFALLSLSVAVPLGALGAYAFTRTMAAFFNVDRVDFSLPPGVLVLQMGVGLAVPLLAALYPVLTRTRISVHQTISDFGPGQERFGASWIDRLCGSRHLRRLPRPLLLALRNTVRRKVRLAFTLAALTVASTVFVGIFGARASLLRTFDLALAYWQYDVEVGFSRPYRMERIQREALQVPGVVRVESWSYAIVRRLRSDGSLGKEMAMVAPPARTPMLEPVLMQGRWLLPRDDNALVINTDVLKDEPDIQVGDEIQLSIEERATTWRVVGVVLGVMTGPIVYANQPYFAYVTHAGGRARWMQAVIDYSESTAHSKGASHPKGTPQPTAVSQAQVAKALEAQYESAGMQVASTAIIADTRARVTRLLDIFTAILSVASLLLAMVGALGLAGTMSMNVLERAREIGVMRAVGASDGTVQQMVMGEGILTGVLSWAAGTLLAWPLGKLLTDAAGMYLLRTPLQYAFSAGGALLWLVIITLLAALASFLPARRASRLTVREVLAYE